MSEMTKPKGYCEQRDRRWNYIAVATIAFGLGVWLGTAFTNGTW